MNIYDNYNIDTIRNVHNHISAILIGIFYLLLRRPSSDGWCGGASIDPSIDSIFATIGIASWAGGEERAAAAAGEESQNG